MDQVEEVKVVREPLPGSGAGGATVPPLDTSHGHDTEVSPGTLSGVTGALPAEVFKNQRAVLLGWIPMPPTGDHGVFM